LIEHAGGADQLIISLSSDFALLAPEADKDKRRVEVRRRTILNLNKITA